MLPHDHLAVYTRLIFLYIDLHALLFSLTIGFPFPSGFSLTSDTFFYILFCCKLAILFLFEIESGFEILFLSGFTQGSLVREQITDSSL